MLKNEKIEISKGRYLELIDAEAKLGALECFGVDNWGGYGDAMEMYNAEREEGVVGE